MARPTASAGSGLRVGSGQQAIALITETLKTGNGWRVGLLGNTGAGKTHLARQLIQHDAGRRMVLIHDDSKAQPEYPQLASYVGAADLRLAPPGAACVGFRGDAFAGTKVDVDQVAAIGVQLARGRMPTTVVVDELNKAVSESGKNLESDQLREAITAGRNMGLCVLYGTQLPQRVPGVVLDNSSAIVLFQLGPHALNYLDERLLFDPEMLAVVPTFKATPDPDVGEFVIHRPGHAWDRTVYRFGPPVRR